MCADSLFPFCVCLTARDHLLAFLQSADDLGHRAVREACRDGNLARAALLSFVGNLDGSLLLAVIDNGALRHRQHALVLVQNNLGIGGHVGFQLATRVVDRDAHLEGGHVVLFHAHGRDLGHLPVKQPAAEALHLDARRLAQIDVRNVGLVHLAIHIDLGRVALGHHQRSRRTQHQNRADRVADLHVARQDHPVHRRHDGGVTELFLELLQAGLVLHHLGPRLLQAGRIHANLGLVCIAPGERGQVILVGVVQRLAAHNAVFLHRQVAVQRGLVHGQIGSRGVHPVLGDIGLRSGDIRLGGGQLRPLRLHLRQNLLLVKLRQRLPLAHPAVDVGKELFHNARCLRLDFDFGDGLNLAGGHHRARHIAARHLGHPVGIDRRAPRQPLQPKSACDHHQRHPGNQPDQESPALP